jgi:hypothetical protein
MEVIEIRIETGNAAFEDEPATEIARILRELADAFERDGGPVDARSGGATLRDVNGNTVGGVRIT